MLSRLLSVFKSPLGLCNAVMSSRWALIPNLKILMKISQHPESTVLLHNMKHSLYSKIAETEVKYRFVLFWGLLCLPVCLYHYVVFKNSN